MKNCEYCDYYRSINEDESGKKAICTFTDTMLYTDFEKSDMEYLCKDVTYQEYLSRRKNKKSTPSLKVTDVKFIYKGIQPVTEREKARFAG